MKKWYIAAMVSGVVASGVLAGDIEITSLQSSGRLTWQGAAVGTTGRVEWAARLESGTTQWLTFTNVLCNNSVMAVDIPMAFRIVGTPSATWPTNGINISFDRSVSLLSKGATATASSEGTYNGITQYAKYAIDGLLRQNGGETWSANAIPAWLKLELPTVQTIYEMEIFFEQHTLTINIEASIDGSNWTTVLNSTEVNPHGWLALYGDQFTNARHRFEFTPSFPAKYVKINVTASDAPGGHIYKARITEVKMYAH